MKVAALFLPLLLVALAVRGAEELNVRLQKGLFEEEANQNIDAAINVYQSILSVHDEERKLAATALFRLGECYRKLNRTNEAVAQYQRLLRDFAEQTTLTKLSQQNLFALGSSGSGQPVTGSRAGSSFQERLNQIVDAAKPNEPPSIESFELQRIEKLVKESPDLVSTTPLLHNAARNSWLRVAEYLLTHGADINLQDAGKATALHVAVSGGNRSMVELLLRYKPNLEILDGQGEAETPLMTAARQGFKALAALLLDAGAAVNASNRVGLNALQLAAANNRKEVAELLLAHHADLEAQGRSGSPLIAAMDKGWESMVKLLLERGAPVDQSWGDRGRTPLVRAIEKGDARMTEILLSYKANPNLRYHAYRLDAFAIASGSSSEASDFTPLMWTARFEQVPIAQQLLKAGADLTLQDAHGDTALIWATRHPLGGAVGPLLDAGADLNAANAAGATPLHTAVGFSSIDTVKLLLDKGARINQPDASGNTPVHLASVYRREEVLTLLLQRGADPNVANAAGQTALDCTKQSLRPGIINSPFSTSMGIGETDTLLRRFGASEYAPRPGLITLCRVSRGFNQPIFFKGTNEWNRHSLLEAFVRAFPAYQSGPTLRLSELHFPDLAHVRVHRRDPQTGKLHEVPFNVEALLQTNASPSDVPLEWGDVIEIPELDHATNEKWEGFAQDPNPVLASRLARNVQIIVKGETNQVRLFPPEVKVRPKISPAGSLASVDITFTEQNAPTPPTPRVSNYFKLREVLGDTGLLRVSSDSSQVKVRRIDPQTSQMREMVFDCSKERRPETLNTDLWLREGDVIEVPEREAQREGERR